MFARINKVLYLYNSHGNFVEFEVVETESMHRYFIILMFLFGFL